MSYYLLQTNKNNELDSIQCIESTAIILHSDYEPLAHHKARMVQATWLTFSFRDKIKPWQNEQQTQAYYQQQKDKADGQLYEAIHDQLTQELAQHQAKKDNYDEAENWRKLLEKKAIKPEQIAQASHQKTRWLSAYQDDLDADITRLLLSSPVQHWQTHLLPSGDVLLSFVFVKDIDQSRFGLIRRLAENDLFITWQTAEKGLLAQ
jgi:hypothetical protein